MTAYVPSRRKSTARLQKKKARPCITCRESFYSEGAHNRMCDKCRTLDVGPFNVPLRVLTP